MPSPTGTAKERCHEDWEQSGFDDLIPQGVLESAAEITSRHKRPFPTPKRHRTRNDAERCCDLFEMTPETKRIRSY
jgi:hypothetical protein